MTFVWVTLVNNYLGRTEQLPYCAYGESIKLMAIMAWGITLVIKRQTILFAYLSISFSPAKHNCMLRSMSCHCQK